MKKKDNVINGIVLKDPVKDKERRETVDNLPKKKVKIWNIYYGFLF